MDHTTDQLRDRQSPENMMESWQDVRDRLKVIAQDVIDLLTQTRIVQQGTLTPMSRTDDAFLKTLTDEKLSEVETTLSEALTAVDQIVTDDERVATHPRDEPEQKTAVESAARTEKTRNRNYQEMLLALGNRPAPVERIR